MHRVPLSSNKGARKVWHTEKLYDSEDVPFPMQNGLNSSAFYYIEIHGHKRVSNSVGYYHPILYLFFDKSNELLAFGHWHYP